MTGFVMSRRLVHVTWSDENCASQIRGKDGLMYSVLKVKNQFRRQDDLRLQSDDCNV